MSDSNDWSWFEYPEPELPDEVPQEEVTQTIEPSEVHFNNIEEAKAYAKLYKFGGFIVCPAKMLSHVRIDKRRNLTLLNITYYPPSKK